MNAGCIDAIIGQALNEGPDVEALAREALRSFPEVEMFCHHDTWGLVWDFSLLLGQGRQRRVAGWRMRFTPRLIEDPACDQMLRSMIARKLSSRLRFLYAADPDGLAQRRARPDLPWPEISADFDQRIAELSHP